MELKGFGTDLQGALAWVVKVAGSNPAGLSELVEFQAFGTDFQGSGRQRGL